MTHDKDWPALLNASFGDVWPSTNDETAAPKPEEFIPHVASDYETHAFREDEGDMWTERNRPHRCWSFRRTGIDPPEHTAPFGSHTEIPDYAVAVYETVNDLREAEVAWMNEEYYR